MKSDVITRGLLLEGVDLLKEYRSRKKTYLEKRIGKNDPVPEGWIVKRDFKTTRRIRKDKSIADQLEDKIWILFYEISVCNLCSKGFTINLKTRKGVHRTRQIDVMAIDQNVVFVVKCKSRESLVKEVLRKDIAEFANDIPDIRNSVKRCLGVRSIQFVFIMATENIEWDLNDIEDAKEKHILVWDEYDLMALHELASIAGEGAKYQLYNRIFYGKRVKDFEIQVPALKAQMGGHTYYTFIMSPEHLLKIAYVHQRSGTCSFLELSDSYQRMIQRSRIRRIEQFIREGGFFPGSIIVNFTRQFVKEEILGDKRRLADIRHDAKPVVITLPPYYGCAWVIDGQHRLYGYADTEHKSRETVPIVAFVKESSATQAKMFVDINKNQKAIKSDLLWDLCEDLYSESSVDKELELRAISRIAKYLNQDSLSPFREQISIPKEHNPGNITLTTVCSSIKQQRLISKDERLLFHSTYDDTILYSSARISAFFNVIREALPEQWDSGDAHYVCTNSGFVVLIGILRDIVECNLTPSEVSDLSKFRKAVEKFLEPLLLHFLDVDSEQIRFYRAAGGASQGSRQVRLELTRVMRDSQVGFRSTWLEQHEAARREENKLEKRRLGVKYYLDKDEDELLEFKGSLVLDVNRWLLGKGDLCESNETAEEGVLKTIGAFLNTKGGDLLIGVLERSRYENVLDNKLSDYPMYKDKIVLGLSNEYGKSGWDGFQQRLLSLIETRIGEDVIDTEMVRILKEHYEESDICHVIVSPADSRQYVANKFFIRRGNKTVSLEGQKIDRYWSQRGRSKG